MNFSYIGSVSSSSKIEKSEKFGELTYIIYLAPHTLSGHNVCSQSSKWCRATCLYDSGRSLMEDESGKIHQARLARTKLFYEDRDKFMEIVINEIRRHKARADKKGMKFSVRLNGTSDLSPEIMKYEGRNILEIFKDIQFYDYTKVFRRLDLISKYDNYDLTFSYSGENGEDCLKALEKGIRVAMVFDKVPEEWLGYKVINGDTYDMRYQDEGGVIVGLKYKRTRIKEIDDSPFIIKTKEVLLDRVYS